jgi:predicted glycoside hydrolase/deacetylase ChbG (UPF0249 family)
MRRLIVNADDLGINQARTHAIFECFEFGVVRSASIIAAGSGADVAARHAREKGLNAGLHLNFTFGAPLCKADEVETLVGSSAGQFRDKFDQRRAFDEDMVDRTHVEREIRAQIEWMLDIYGQPTHVDGHHQMHVHPFIVPILLPILERYAIERVRVPLEEPLPPHGYEVPDDALRHVESINIEAREAKKFFDAHGIRSTDHFRGLTLVGRASQKNLRHILSRLPEGTTELMVHPGAQTPIGSDFDLDPQRQTEAQMLLQEDLPSQLAERKIELISYADLH